MKTLMDLARGTPQAVRIFFERGGLRGGPFVGVDDPGALLALPHGSLAGGRTFVAGEQPSGRITLRSGVIKDAALRHNLRTATFCGTPEYLDLWLADGDKIVARWHLDDARIVEVADRTRRAADDESFAYLVVEGRLGRLAGGAAPGRG